MADVVRRLRNNIKHVQLFEDLLSSISKLKMLMLFPGPILWRPSRLLTVCVTFLTWVPSIAFLTGVSFHSLSPGCLGDAFPVNAHTRPSIVGRICSSTHLVIHSSGGVHLYTSVTHPEPLYSLSGDCPHAHKGSGRAGDNHGLLRVPRESCTQNIPRVYHP
jgi:hypothetical protein